jgi:hypothetical protein
MVAVCVQLFDGGCGTNAGKRSEHGLLRAGAARDVIYTTLGGFLGMTRGGHLRYRTAPGCDVSSIDSRTAVQHKGRAARVT